MASPSLIPAGDFRTSYAADTTIFPTTTSRNAAIAGIVLICFAPQVLSEYWLSILIQIGIFAIAALGLNILVGFTGQISIGHAAFFLLGAFTSAYISNNSADPGVLRHSTGGRCHGTGRPDLRRAGGAAQGTLSRHRDAGRAIHPARFLLTRRLVQRRLGAGQRQSVLDLRLHVPWRPAIFLRRTGLPAGQLPPGDQPDAHARWPRAGRDPRPLSVSGNHGHQSHEIPHAVIRPRGVLCRDQRERSMRIISWWSRTKVSGSNARSSSWP